MKLRLAVAAVVAFVIAFLLSAALLSVLGEGGGSAKPASAGQINWTIDDAKNFRGFSLFWLGENYDGLPLTKIIRYKFQPDPSKMWVFPEDSVTFLYGSCTPSPDSGCAAPVQIILEPYCMRPPELLAEGVRGTPFAVRQAVAEQVGDHLRLWTGDASITIFADGLQPQTEIAAKIMPVDASPGDSLDALGPPDTRC
jgi:hypothetical protein